MNFKKFTKAEKRKLHKRVRELFREGKNYKEMTPILNGEGFLKPTGQPLTPDAVSFQGRQAGLKTRNGNRRARRQELAAIGIENDESQVLADIILDANISDSKKINLLKGLRKK